MNKTKYPPITARMILTALVLMFAFSCECPAQEVQPTPADQSELSEWWDWCMVHPKVIYRISKKYEVNSGGGQHIRPYKERLKVPGPSWITPFGSMRRWRTYIEKYNNQGFAGLNNQGWNYQTLETTGIGEGQWTKETWGGAE